MNEQTRQLLMDIRNAYESAMNTIGLIRVGFDPETDSIDKALDEVVVPLRKIWEVLPKEIKRAL